MRGGHECGALDVAGNKARERDEARGWAAGRKQAGGHTAACCMFAFYQVLMRSCFVLVLQRGETIAKALKRLGGANAAAGKALGKREKQRLQQQQAAEGGAGEGTGAAAGAGNSGPFMRMVEIADLLVEEGEMDVYDATKEDLERSAAMWLPKQAVQAAGAGAGAAAGGSGAAGKAAAAADDDDDMFASEDAADDKAAKAGAGAQAGAGAAGAKQGEAAAVEAGDGTDYASWPVKELKRFLQVWILARSCASC